MIDTASSKCSSVSLRHRAVLAGGRDGGPDSTALRTSALDVDEADAVVAEVEHFHRGLRAGRRVTEVGQRR